MGSRHRSRFALSSGQHWFRSACGPAAKTSVMTVIILVAAWGIAAMPLWPQSNNSQEPTLEETLIWLKNNLPSLHVSGRAHRKLNVGEGAFAENTYSLATSYKAAEMTTCNIIIERRQLYSTNSIVYHRICNQTDMSVDSESTEEIRIPLGVMSTIAVEPLGEQHSVFLNNRRPDNPCSCCM